MNKIKEGLIDVKRRTRYRALAAVLPALLLACALAGCGSGETTGGGNAATITGTGVFYREGFTYQGVDLIMCGGKLYQYRWVSIRVPEGMRLAGEISETVDGIPKADFENSRDLDPGTKLYLLPDTDSYLFVCAAGEEPPAAGQLWHGGYHLTEPPEDEEPPGELNPFAPHSGES